MCGVVLTERESARASEAAVDSEITSYVFASMKKLLISCISRSLTANAVRLTKRLDHDIVDAQIILIDDRFNFCFNIAV